MLISDKIKFLRKTLGYTQSDLAVKSNIHSVSIRKYETNKMKPQVEQIEKLATALEVYPFALLDVDNKQIKTTGDFYGILIYLYKSDVISFNQSITNRENINIEFSPNILKFISLNNHINGITEEVNYHTYSISINDKLKQTPTYNCFVKLVEYYYRNQQDETVEALELELQQSPELLENL